MHKIKRASVCAHLGPKKKALQKGCWICWVLTGTIFFLVLPIHFFLLYVMYQGPRTPCYGKWGLRAGDHDVRSTFRQGVYLHRGNVLAAQENTLGAFATPSPAKFGKDNLAGFEFDIFGTSQDGVSEAFLFHDATMQRMTGLGGKFEDYSPAEIKNMTVLSTIDGYDYHSTTRIPTISEFMEQACRPNGYGVVFDIKNQVAADRTIDMLKDLKSKHGSSGPPDNTACDTTVNSPSVFSIGSPGVARSLSVSRDEAGIGNRISFFTYPSDQYNPFGEYFFLRTGILYWMTSADILELHYSVWDKEYDIIENYEKRGWCTAVYGHKHSDMHKYPSASMQTVDWRPHFPDTPGGVFGGGGGDVKYDEFRFTFYVVSILGWASLPMSVFSWYVVFGNLNLFRNKYRTIHQSKLLHIP